MGCAAKERDDVASCLLYRQLSKILLTGVRRRQIEASVAGAASKNIEIARLASAGNDHIHPLIALGGHPTREPLRLHHLAIEKQEDE